MLTSRTFAEMRKDKDIGRSEAFRRSMLALISDRNAPGPRTHLCGRRSRRCEGGAPAKVAAVTVVGRPSAGTLAVAPDISATPPVAIEPQAQSKTEEPATPALARRKMKRKPASDGDWITNIVAQ